MLVDDDTGNQSQYWTRSTHVQSLDAVSRETNHAVLYLLLPAYYTHEAHTQGRRSGRPGAFSSGSSTAERTRASFCM